MKTLHVARWSSLSTLQGARSAQSFNLPRVFSSSAVAMASKAKFSEGSDEAVVSRQLDELLSRKWVLTHDGQGIERPFKFKTFAKTWDFMTAVSLQCKLRNHHPEWSNVYNTTFIRWTTHSPPGLSAKDTSLAMLCDELGKDFGEVKEDAPGGDSVQVKGLADHVASISGDCCVPNKSDCK